MYERICIPSPKETVSVQEFNKAVVWSPQFKGPRTWTKIYVNLSELSHYWGEFLSSYPITSASFLMECVLMCVYLLYKKETLLQCMDLHLSLSTCLRSGYSSVEDTWDLRWCLRTERSWRIGVSIRIQWPDWPELVPNIDLHIDNNSQLMTTVADKYIFAWLPHWSFQ